MKMSLPRPSLHPGSSPELRALDCNLTSICDHIQLEGFNLGSFSDIVVHAMGSTYYLHRLILSRSSYFRNMLHGPWKEANAEVVTLNVDDNNVNAEAIAMALAYLYGHHPRLNDSNAFRVLAAASFLDLQDLCAICTDFIISELWTSNFLAFQVFAESQDYGMHGERVRNACWCYLCQSGALELKQVLPNLSSRTLYALLNADALWIPSEEKRFELALFALLAKVDLCKTEVHDTHIDSINNSANKQLESELDLLNLKDSHRSIHNNTLNEVVNYVVEIDTGIPIPKLGEQCSSLLETTGGMRPSCSYVEACRGPSEDEFQNNIMSNDWPPLPWGTRIVGTHGYERENCGLRDDEFEAFLNIFEGGSLSYCNMSFEALINVRKQLEDLGFPCKAVNDGLWLQMLLSQRVQEIVADTCKNCCLTTMACACRQPRASCTIIANPGSDHIIQNGNNIYVANGEEGRPVRAHTRGPVDGLAGIGHGSTAVTPSAWPPTRFVFSRVPYGITCRSGNGPPPICNDDLEGRVDQNVAVSGDVLTSLIRGGRNMRRFFEKQSENQKRRLGGAACAEMMDSSQEDGVGIGWDNAGTSVSLDLKTPLIHFPPFRFGVEFKDVEGLADGEVKHSPEAYYAGSLWKVSVQAFNDEDPQGRRTVGLFLHRRKAEMSDVGRKVHMFVDSREKVIARYKLLCPSKREVMVLGNFKEGGNLLPKAPKGWGWRSALLFDELHHLLQNGALRVAAVLQLVSPHH